MHFAAKLDDRYDMLGHSTVDHVFYAAVRDRHTTVVSAFVALTRWTRSGLHNFGHKDMDGVLTELLRMNLWCRRG